MSSSFSRHDLITARAMRGAAELVFRDAHMRASFPSGAEAPERLTECWRRISAPMLVGFDGVRDGN